MDTTIAGLDLKVVGWVLMAAGVIGLVLYFYFWNRRRTPQTAVTPQAPQAPDAGRYPVSRPLE